LLLYLMRAWVAGSDDSAPSFFLCGAAMTQNVSDFFAASYRQARAGFLDAAQRLQVPVQSHRLLAHQGAEGEDLAMDVAVCGAPDASRLLIISSGMHGVEGFCGSGCQIALMHDEELMARLNKAGMALLLVHAINPYGFSHLCRVNENGVDLNRNFLDFTQDLPSNPGYAQIHRHLIPDHWPAGEQDAAALAAYAQEHGPWALREAMSSGQASHADGLFHSGTAPSWSNTCLRAVIQTHAASCDRVAWIDLHTGLGPWGHGEKIFAGRNEPSDLARARACWGADVFSPFDGESYSVAVRGAGANALYDECPQADRWLMGLEFGTWPFDVVSRAVALDQWLNRHPDHPQAAMLRPQVRDAFYVDSPEWRGMVVGQTRVSAVQALAALAAP
jgi:hypothetical protein